jgi:hypothetical protein
MHRSLQIYALILCSASIPLSAQTVLTNSSSTTAACPGGAHTGPPIVICGVNNSGNYILGGNIMPTTTDGIDIIASKTLVGTARVAPHSHATIRYSLLRSIFKKS